MVLFGQYPASYLGEVHPLLQGLVAVGCGQQGLFSGAGHTAVKSKKKQKKDLDTRLKRKKSMLLGKRGPFRNSFSPFETPSLIPPPPQTLTDLVHPLGQPPLSLVRGPVAGREIGYDFKQKKKKKT